MALYRKHVLYRTHALYRDAGGGGPVGSDPVARHQSLKSLSAADRRAYILALDNSHRIQTRVDVYDADENLIGPLEGNIVAGQVDADTTNSIDRTLQLTVEDPNVKFMFDPIGPVYADKFLSATYSVYVDALGLYVDVPIFYGIISLFKRDGFNVTLEAQSKEALMMPPIQMNFPTPARSQTVAEFIKAAAQAFGETKFRLSNMSDARVSGDDRNLLDNAHNTGSSVWDELVKLAKAHDHQLFYDSEGYLTGRRFPSQASPAHTFLDSLTEPIVAFDLSQARNQVKVFAKDTKKSVNTTLQYVANLGPGRPLSARSLARGGVNRVLTEKLTFDKVMTHAEAKAAGDRLLAQRSSGAQSVTFDALPVPHIQLLDVLDIKTRTVNATFLLDKYSIGLRAQDSMSIGYNKAMHFVPKFRARHRFHHK